MLPFRHRRQKHSSWAVEIQSPWLEDYAEFAEVADSWEPTHAKLYATSSNYSVPSYVNTFDEQVLHAEDRTTSLGHHRRQKHMSWFPQINSPWLTDSDVGNNAAACDVIESAAPAMTPVQHASTVPGKGHVVEHSHKDHRAGTHNQIAHPVAEHHELHPSPLPVTAHLSDKK